MGKRQTTGLSAGVQRGIRYDGGLKAPHFRVDLRHALSMQEPLLPAAPEDSGLAADPDLAGPQHGAHPGQARQIRAIAKPRSISGSLYTMARSMRLFPTALSPHR